jgi:hypothetical protein
MIYEVFLIGMRPLSHVNIQVFVLFFVDFLTLCRSDDGVNNGPKLVTQKTCKSCCERLYFNSIKWNRVTYFAEKKVSC